MVLLCGDVYLVKRGIFFQGKQNSAAARALITKLASGGKAAVSVTEAKMSVIRCSGEQAEAGVNTFSCLLLGYSVCLMELFLV